MERKNAWNEYEEAEVEKVNDVAEQYRRFISDCKAERECASMTIRMAE